MLTILLIILIIFLLGGFGWRYNTAGSARDPFGILMLILVICLIVWLVRGAL